MRLLSVVCVLFVLSACQTNRLTHMPVNNMVAYERHQIRDIAYRGDDYARVSGRVIAPGEYPFFSENSFGRHWARQRHNRVIAVGHPAACATYNARWGHYKAFQAIERTMNTCLTRVKELGKHLGKKCGCRLAALNNTVFLSAKELPFRKTLPAIALVKDDKGRREILGYALTSGRSGKQQPMDFYTQSDRQVCKGHYDLGKLSTQGKAHLNCFNGRIKGPAVFKVAGFREGQVYGTALVKAGENELILVYGLPSDEFEKRRAEVLAQ